MYIRYRVFLQTVDQVDPVVEQTRIEVRFEIPHILQGRLESLDLSMDFHYNLTQDFSLVSSLRG